MQKNIDNSKQCLNCKHFEQFYLRIGNTFMGLDQGGCAVSGKNVFALNSCESFYFNNGCTNVTIKQESN